MHVCVCVAVSHISSGFICSSMCFYFLSFTVFSVRARVCACVCVRSCYCELCHDVPLKRKHVNHTQTHAHTWKSIKPCAHQVARGGRSHRYTPSPPPPPPPLNTFFTTSSSTLHRLPLLHIQFASSKFSRSQHQKKQSVIRSRQRFTIPPSIAPTVSRLRSDKFIFLSLSLLLVGGWGWEEQKRLLGVSQTQSVFTCV